MSATESRAQPEDLVAELSAENTMLITLPLEAAQLPPHFWSKVRIAASGCWEWIGARIGDGYGNWWKDGRSYLTHRLSYEALVGPIPADLEMDHLCRNRACLNPQHLEPVTRSVNQRRGVGPERLRQQYADVTHCPSGHPYSGDNLYRWPRNGHRHCKTCLRAKDRKRRRVARERQQRGSSS